MIIGDVKLNKRNEIKSLVFRSNEEISIVARRLRIYKTLIINFLYIYIE